MFHKIKICKFTSFVFIELYFTKVTVKVVLSLGDYLGASCYACVGGNNMKTEIHRLQTEPQQIIVGTPGRVFDMITRKVTFCLVRKTDP